MKEQREQKPCLHGLCRVASEEDEVKWRTKREQKPCLHGLCRVASEEDEVKWRIKREQKEFLFGKKIGHSRKLTKISTIIRTKIHSYTNIWRRRYCFCRFKLIKIFRSIDNFFSFEDVKFVIFFCCAIDGNGHLMWLMSFRYAVFIVPSVIILLISFEK